MAVDDMIAALVSAAPFVPDDELRMIDLGSGDASPTGLDGLETGALDFDLGSPDTGDTGGYGR